MAAVLGQVRREGPKGLMRVVVGVNPPLHSMEEEVVRGEALGLGLPDGAEVLP